MLTIHMGPHKTGSSFIQRRMVQNRALLGPQFQTVVQKDLPLFSLVEAIHPIRTRPSAIGAAATIRERSRLLGKIFAEAENTLISSEDLMGPLPSRAGITGLYPFAEVIMPAIMQGFEQANAPFQFVFYRRNYGEWLRSVYRYRFRHAPDRAFAPKQFKKRHGLPENWDAFLVRLTEAVGAGHLRILSFEQDRASGHFGQGLFDLAGVSRAVQAQFAPLDPVNVSQPETVDPKHWL